MATIVVLVSEPIVRDVVVRILRRAGHTVHDTGEFHHALELVAALTPDLVVTNVFLRGVSGHDAMLLLKERFPSLNVLMLSGLPDQDVIGTWTGKAGFDIFPKPFHPDEFVMKVGRILTQQ